MAFRLRHDPMKRKACVWTVSYRVPLRETRSTRAPTVRLEVVAACGFDPRRDDHLGSTFVRDFMSPLTNKGETRRAGIRRAQQMKGDRRACRPDAARASRASTHFTLGHGMSPPRWPVRLWLGG